MDGSRFDAFTRSLGSGSRRGVVQLIAGTGVGAALLGSLGTEEAAAKCVAPGKKCKKKGKKKRCCGGAKCQGKRCTCQSGTFACGKSCCSPGQLCVSGSCSNGPIPIGGECNKAEPGACTSGVCGCNFGTCTCREADCVGLGGACANDVSCCLGICFGGLTCQAP